MQLICFLPKLQQLDLVWQPLRRAAWNPDIAFPPQLEVLKLRLEPARAAAPRSRVVMVQTPHRFLPPCAKLKALSILGGCSRSFRLQATHAWMTNMITTNFRNLQHLTIKGWEPADGAVPDAWHSTNAISAETARVRELFVPLSACQQLESLDLNMRPQVSFQAVLPLIQRLPRFHTLGVTSYLAASAIGATFELPPELYSTIASQLAFRTLKVDSRGVETVEWRLHNELPSFNHILSASESA
jgi:hypothetical protein